MASSSLHQLSTACNMARRSIVANPLDHALWTGPQLDFFALPGPYRVWYGANGQGKTHALAAEFVWRLRGRHPFRHVHKPPVELLLMVEGFEAQSTVDIAGAIWHMLHPDEVDETCGFTPGRGLKGRPPRIVLSSGPGKGSILHLSTYGSGARRAAGGTRHFVGCNEPMPEAMDGELISRGRGVMGEVAIVFTPTLTHPPQDWLAKKCHSGKVQMPDDDIPRDWIYDRRIGGGYNLLQTELTRDSLRLVHPDDTRRWAE